MVQKSNIRSAHMLPAVLFALLAAGLAFLVSTHIYQNRPLTADENSYLFQSRNFIEGRIARRVPPISRAFDHTMIIQDHEAGWLSRYPPAHPVWLMPGVLLEYPQIMSHIGAALGVLLLAATAKCIGILPCFAAGLLLLSPFYLFVYGSLLSHTSGFLATVALLLFYVRWQQSRHPAYAALAGLFWGLLFLNRTYTAFLLAIPFGIDASLSVLIQRNKHQVWGCCSFASISAFFFAIYRLYNKAATGSSRLPTFLLYDPSEGLGFGPRHTDGLVVHHTFELGIQNILENLTIMDQWLWGFTGGLILVAILFLIGWNKRWSPLLLAAPLAIWAGHILFWHPGIEHFRPVYFFETLAFLVLAAALGLQRLWQFTARTPGRRMLWFACIPVAMLLAGTPFILERITFFYEHNAESRRVYDTIRKAPPQALVLIEGFDRKPLGENMLNLHGLESDPLVARSNPYWNQTLAILHPDRQIFLLSPGTHGLQPVPRTDTTHYKIPATGTHRHTGANLTPNDGTHQRYANPSFNPGLVLFGRYPQLLAGTWKVRMHYTLSDVHPEQPVRFEVAADRGMAVLTETNLYLCVSNGIADLTIQIDNLREIEPRVFYGGSGSIWIDSVEVQRKP